MKMYMCHFNLYSAEIYCCNVETNSRLIGELFPKKKIIYTKRQLFMQWFMEKYITLLNKWTDAQVIIGICTFYFAVIGPVVL